MGVSGPAQSLAQQQSQLCVWFLTVHGRALGQEATDDGSDSEEELAAFCPKVMELLEREELSWKEQTSLGGTCSI